MKRIASIFLSSLLLMGMVSCGNSDVDIPRAPEFSDVATELVKYNEVLLKATCSDTNFESGGFVITEEGAGETATVSATVSGSSLQATVSNLKADASYSFTAFVRNSVGNQVESNTGRFRTGSAPEPESIVSIPDPNLKAWLLVRYDTDGDGEISYAEAENIDMIEMNSDNVSSLVGVECFPNLKHLHAEGSRKDDIAYGQITEVDLSANMQLDHIYLVGNRISKVTFPSDCIASHIEFNYNELTEFDASALKSVELLSVSWNKIKALDFSGLENLKELHCNDNPLETLVLANSRLEYVDCHNTNIKTLDLRNCPLINTIDCSSCPALKEILLKKTQVPGTITKDETATVIYE